MTTINNENIAYDKSTINRVKLGLVSWISQLELTLNSAQKFDDIVGASPEQQREKKAVLKKYSNFIRQFDQMDTDMGVFVHCSALFRRVMERRKSSSSLQDLLYVFATCLFLSFKYVVDETVCYLADYSDFVHLDKEVIRVLEQGILINILNFNVHVDRKTFETELNYLSTIASKI